MNKPRILLTFAAMSRPVSLVDCGKLQQRIAAVLRGWDIKEITDSVAPANEPVIEIKKTTDGYSRSSAWLLQPAVFVDDINATCDFLIDLIKYYISSELTDKQPLICLHCAAVTFKDSLLIFPSIHESGKSTLSVHLAASGARVFADDVLPIENVSNHGIAPGILPRLRMPFPGDTGDVFNNFISTRQGLRNNDLAYIDLRHDELAPLGTTAPISTIIVLQRDPKGKTELIEKKKSDTLKDSIMRSFSGEMAAIDILDRLHAIVDNAECFTLHYTSGDKGAQLLRDTFG